MVFILELFPLALMSLLLFGAAVYFLVHGVPQGAIDVVEKQELLTATDPNYTIIFFLFIVLMFLWNFAFMIITNYYLDCWVITDRRTIHTELRGFFSRFYSSVSHYKVQDVTVDVRGILPTIMKYGDLKIQTAGAFRKFVFRQIPEPYETKKVLLEQSDRYRGYRRGKRKE